MHRILLAFKAFFLILFKGRLPEELIPPAGRAPAAAAPPALPQVRTEDGALQMLSILQRDSRLVDFVMEDIAPYSDEQVGAAVRTLHDQCREALLRYMKLEPVIDGVEGTYTRTPEADASALKFVGNVPAGTPQGGLLRHKGWRAVKVELPAVNPRADNTVVAPAEIEIE